MSTQPDPTASDDAPSMAMRCVRALMERHNLPRYRQSAWLAEATGLSYAQAHRRLNGGAPWSLEDLERVAGLLGETLLDLVGSAEPSAAVAGVLHLGTRPLACELWIGKELPDPTPDTVVAIKTGSGWAAVYADEASGQPTYAVDRMQARPGAARRKVMAVLDDDHDVTDSACAHLEGSGFDAKPFYKTEDLQAALKLQRFDGFVIDWIVGESSTLKLIAALRAQEATAPIIVLTAQMLSGKVEEAEIAEAVARFNLVFSEKPVRMGILLASLTRAFAAR